MLWATLRQAAKIAGEKTELFTPALKSKGPGNSSTRDKFRALLSNRDVVKHQNEGVDQSKLMRTHRAIERTKMVKRRPHMNKTGLRLQLTGQVTLVRFEQVLEAWTDFLREIGQEVAGAKGRDAVRYVITEASSGSLTLGVRPQPAREDVPARVIPRIAKTVTSGLRSLERSARRPKHFSDTALVRLRHLTLLRGPEIPAIKIGNGTGDVVSLSSKLAAHVEEVLAPELESIGTVEGNLEGLIIHGKRRFLVYDPLTSRQITCYFTPRVDWQTVLKAFGKRVAVTGLIRTRSSGDRVSVTASRLYVFPPEEELPAPEDVLGAVKRAR